MENKTKTEKKCKVEGCKRPYRAKDYCNVHYKKWRHGELPHSRFNTCHAEGCHKRVVAHGLCEEHAKAKAGTPAEAPAAAPAAETPPAAAPSA